MREFDFVVQGRRIRMVIAPEGAAYVLYRVGATTLISKADGSAYQIDARGRCSCLGYKHRHSCKHVSWNREGL